VDGELGYNTMLGGLGVRLFAGARFARFSHDNKISGFTDGMGTFFKNLDQRFTGIGPRIGLDFSARLGNSNFSIFGDVAGSLLFGKLRTKVSGDVVCMGDCSDSESRKVWNLEGQVGLGYEIAPAVTIGAGYRAEYWHHVAEIATQNNRLMHGPFVRIAYNFGAPPLMPMAAVTPPPPPGQPAVTKKAFIVFFDFDRSNITAEGQKTINDAAAAAKAGNAAQVSVTGHADRSGTEQYNLALSMRRAEMVKAGLIRLGMPASMIVVVAKGESQPLVQTADGVREAQNRRVEILI
jgi:outer membrane protein OmpA-like peptidoglycan-associated protein